MRRRIALALGLLAGLGLTAPSASAQQITRCDADRPTQLVLVLSQGAAYARIPSVPTAPMLLHGGGEASSLRLALVG